MNFTRPLAILALLLTAGCSAIPGGESPQNMGSGQGSLGYRVCVAPVSVSLAKKEEPKEYRPDEVAGHNSVQTHVADWVEAAGLFDEVHVGSGKDEAEVLDGAWERRDQLLLELSLRSFQVTFDGHNDWWIPNILNWLFWIVPSWWVATEEYTLSFDVEMVLRSVDSLQQVHSEQFDVQVMGTFDEFDRGWQPFGFIWPFNDADNWRQIAAALLPAASSSLGKKVALALDTNARTRLAGESVKDRTRKTMAVAIGLSHYKDSVRYPPLPYAADDAHALSRALVNDCGLQTRHVATLVGTQALRTRLEATLDELTTRLNPGDQLLVYFAGYGTRTAAGEPALLLYDAGPKGAGMLTLADVGAMLAKIPLAEKLVVIDSSFDGLGRSISSGATPWKTPDVKALRNQATAILLATGRGQHALSPEHLGAGLFSHHLLRCLRGVADLDEDGLVSLREIFKLVRKRSEAESALFGKVQRPTAAGLEHPFGLRLLTRSNAK